MTRLVNGIDALRAYVNEGGGLLVTKYLYSQVWSGFLQGIAGSVRRGDSRRTNRR